MATATEPKMYTDAEIDELPLAKLEKFAALLEWRGPRYGYYSGYGKKAQGGMRAFQTTGHPTVYGQTTVRDRAHFLRLRLKSSSQEKWNPEVKELIAKQKKEAEKKAAEEFAKQPKVTVKNNPVIELKDHRAKGHTFIIERKNGQIVAQQKQTHKGSVGRSICAQQGNYTAKDFQDAVELICELDLSECKTVKKGNASLHIAVVLSGNYNLEFARKGDIIGIRQQDNYRNNTTPMSLKDSDWQFNKEDLLKVIKYMTAKVKVTIEEA